MEQAPALEEIEREVQISPKKTGKWKSYPEYKDSGVEWIGVMPKGWDCKRLKFVGDAIIGLTYSPDDVSSEEEGTLVLRANNIQNGKLVLKDNVYVSGIIPRKLRTKFNDILICSRNGSQKLVGKSAKVSKVTEGMSFGAFTTVVRSDLNDYLFYLFNSGIITEYAGRYQTSTIFQLTTGVLNQFELPIPPLSEQKTIAAFLDYYTAKIDALIEKKKKLIELLKEKRMALISHAVTKGLDPNAKMKDSGVQWLGEIPEGWEVKRLKFISPNQEVGLVINPSSYFQDDGVPILLGNNVKAGYISLRGVKRVSKEDNNGPLRKSKLNSGDIVVVRVGEPGVACQVPRELDGCNCASVMIIRKSESVASSWIENSFNSSFLKHQIDLVKYGGAQKQFNIAHAVNFLVVVPPESAQRFVTNTLEKAITELRDCVAIVKKSVLLLSEYRTALVSAVVTGKIDVRDWKPPQ